MYSFGVVIASLNLQTFTKHRPLKELARKCLKPVASRCTSSELLSIVTKMPDVDQVKYIGFNAVEKGYKDINWRVYVSTALGPHIYLPTISHVCTLFKIQDPKNHIPLSSTYLFRPK